MDQDLKGSREEQLLLGSKEEEEHRWICFVRQPRCQLLPKKKGATDSVRSIAKKGLLAIGSQHLATSWYLIGEEKEENGEMFHHCRQVLPDTALSLCMGQQGILVFF